MKSVEKKERYVADFETLVLAQEAIDAGKPTYVWAWALCDCNNIDKVIYGTDIASFFKQLGKLKSGSEVYFHNLKFDGQFLVSYMLKNGWQQVESNRKMPENTFTSLVSEIGIWYSLQIKINKKNIHIQDSLKKLPFSVRVLAKQLGLPEEKGEIDYKKYREEGGTLSQEDKDYIRRDVQIVARALNEVCFKKSLFKMTIASDCMKYYKDTFPKFKEYYPELSDEEDEFCRNAYKGGYCYVNPKIQEKLIRKIGTTYDYNSMYPSVMHSQSGYPYPIGKPVYYKGQYKQDWKYDLYIQHFVAMFKLKKGKVPTVQIKNSIYYKESEYLSEVTEPVELYMTNIDLQRFFDHYDIFSYIPIDGYKFESSVGMFDEYIDHWYKYKEECTISGDKVGRMQSKLMLNSLYGKFATSTNATMQKFYLDEDGIVKHDNIEKEKKGIYVPIGAFITAYARKELLDAIQANYNIFCYCDTDSIHITAPEAKGIKVHDSKLGFWKKESTWDKAKFLRQKTYSEHIYDPKNNSYYWDYKACGMNDEVKENIKDIDDFFVGGVYPGKKIVKRVPGGVVITETTFRISLI